MCNAPWSIAKKDTLTLLVTLRRACHQKISQARFYWSLTFQYSLVCMAASITQASWERWVGYLSVTGWHGCSKRSFESCKFDKIFVGFLLKKLWWLLRRPMDNCLRKYKGKSDRIQTPVGSKSSRIVQFLWKRRQYCPYTQLIQLCSNRIQIMLLNYPLDCRAHTLSQLRAAFNDVRLKRRAKWIGTATTSYPEIDSFYMCSGC